jgi:NaMN:DMB phosphoribosyltransferase
MTNSIFDKTDKGREEIATRKYHLATRLRTLLLLIDGKHRTEDLLIKLTGMGLTEESLTELLNDGFIQAVATAPAAARPQAAPAPVAAQPAVSSGARVLPDGQTQFEAIYHFYTETIKSTIGLRGYGLQLKVEKAGTIEELRELRRPYLEAVLKAKGNEMARGLRLRLDELLYYGETVPPHSTILDLNTEPPK